MAKKKKAAGGSKKTATTAQQYNESKRGKLWAHADLPAVLRESINHPRQFEKKVRLLQRAYGLVVDGKLGPKTFKALGCVHTEKPAAKPKPKAPKVDSDDGAKNALVVDGGEVATPFPVTQHPRLKSRARRAGTVINTLLIHQSITSSVRSTERVLRNKGLGVHLMIDGDGSIHQFGDLIEQMAHANERNSNSIGIEVVNPYTRTRGYWTEMIDPSPVAWRGREASDTPEQIDALGKLCAFLASPSHSWEGSQGVTIKVPLETPTQGPDGPSRGEPGWFDKDVGGIIAHGHRPSRYPEGHTRAGERVKGGHADARRTVWLLKQRMAV